MVDAAYVKERLQSPAVKVLDVRTQMEWNNGHLPGATLILWQDLYADQRMQKFKSLDEIRALITKTGLAPNQSVVTYCAVGLRASLMYWAARSAGIPARVYVGSWQDWQQRSSGINPIADTQNQGSSAVREFRVDRRQAENRSPARYFRPESTATVATTLPGPSSFARSAARRRR